RSHASENPGGLGAEPPRRHRRGLEDERPEGSSPHAARVHFTGLVSSPYRDAKARRGNLPAGPLVLTSVRPPLVRRGLPPRVTSPVLPAWPASFPGASVWAWFCGARR